MNPVQSIAASNAAYKVQPAATAKPADAPAAVVPPRGADTVELSGMQTFLATLKANDIRADKVAQVRAQIAAGTYETDDKLSIAADRLLDDLG